MTVSNFMESANNVSVRLQKSHNFRLYPSKFDCAIISAPILNQDEQLSVYLAHLAELSIVYYYESTKHAM